MDQRRLVHLLLILALCTVACLVNPWTTEALAFPFEHVRMKNITIHTFEWMPAGAAYFDFNTSMLLFRLSLPFVLFSFIVNRRRARLSHLILTALTMYMALTAWRFLPTYFIAVMPLTWHNFRRPSKNAHLLCCLNLSATKTGVSHQTFLNSMGSGPGFVVKKGPDPGFDFSNSKMLVNRPHAQIQTPRIWAFLKGLRARKTEDISAPISAYTSDSIQRIKCTRAWASLTGVLLAAVLIIQYGYPVSVSPLLTSRIGGGFNENFVFSDATEFLKKNDIRERMYNDMGMGGWLIYKLWPQSKVFIDGRTPLYGDMFLKNVVEATKNYRNFEAFERAYDFEVIVMMTASAWEMRAFHLYLWNRPEWKLVLFTPSSIVYLKDTPRQHEIIARTEMKENPLIEMMKKEGTLQIKSD